MLAIQQRAYKYAPYSLKQNANTKLTRIAYFSSLRLPNMFFAYSFRRQSLKPLTHGHWQGILSSCLDNTSKVGHNLFFRMGVPKEISKSSLCFTQPRCFLRALPGQSSLSAGFVVDAPGTM